MMKYSGNISILRQIRRELSRKISRTKLPDEIGKSTKHMLSLFRLPGEPEESGRVHAYLANSYLTYLRSSRRQDELMSKYFHKPERSVEQSARLVGLSLPKRAE